MNELLLPVGNVEMALAAIHNGADAIYLGFPGYNARGRAIDIEVQELREIIQTCHLYGVRAHLALNIVIFQDELEKLLGLLDQILLLKPDAIIVQDLGLASLIRKMAPNQILHASTQMTVTNHEAIALLEDLNIKRFVLGRENSLKEIGLIKEQTDKDLEVFVHGALCVSYSGQCFTSESIGGRSANRGQCAQSCRFGYEMWVDGQKRNLVEKQFLLSPQDLCGLAEIPALMDMGVASFKVEGRLKSPEYVAAATQEYRKAIDRHLVKKTLSEEEVQASQEQMAMTYSRGLFSGWLHGVNHQKLVDGSGKSHRGHLIGLVTGVRASDRGTSMLVTLEKEVELSSGDGLLWVYWQGEEQVETGAQIYNVRRVGQRQFEIEFGNEIILNPEIKGARLYFNHDASQKKELRHSFHDKQCFKKIPVDVVVEVCVGAPLKVTMTDGYFTSVTEGASLVQEAKNRAVTDEFIQEELGALGGGVFTLREFVCRRQNDQGIFYPHKELKEIRRQLTGELERLRSESRVFRDETEVRPSEEIKTWLQSAQQKNESLSAVNATKLNVLLREKSQVFDFVSAWQKGQIDQSVLHSVILDFEFGMDYEPSLLALKESKIRCGIATTRVLKPKEYTNFRLMERLAPDLILIRNLGALQYFTQVSPFQGELRGDFSLNVTNHLSAQYLFSKGLSSLTASYDLNSEQVSALLAVTDANRFEITAHQYMPSFHMEHCAFAALLSTGSSFRDCGKPCEKHRVEFKDQFGNRHQIKSDQECRNTLFNATSQSAARFIESWQKQSLGSIRYEALYEKGSELIDKIIGYQDLLSGKRSAQQVIQDLKLLETYGLGEGAIGKTQEYQSKKKS